MLPTLPAETIAGGLYGLLVGDALGVPYEFRRATELPALDLIEMPPPPSFRRSHPNAPPGAWSDDGAQALCLLASLLHCGELDICDLGQRLLRWMDSGYMTVDGVVFDVGNQTRIALSALRRGSHVEEAAPRGAHNNGNGSLMRVLPLALWHQGSDAELISDAARQSLVTHAHLRSQLCCALYCLWVRATLRGAPDAWKVATAALRTYCLVRPEWVDELETHIFPDAVPGGSGSGYVVDCLHSARLALEEPTFERTIKRAVSLGNDTDTTAAIAGGLAGLRYGLAAIPHRWLAALPARDLVDSLLDALLARSWPAV